MKTLNVAIIGQGRSGRDIHGAFFKSDANTLFNVVAVVDEIELPVQINGKVRDRLTVAVDIDKDALQEQVLALPHIKEFIGDKKVVKFIVVPKKIINIVIK